jgi:hypothetical protein
MRPFYKSLDQQHFRADPQTIAQERISRPTSQQPRTFKNSQSIL